MDPMTIKAFWGFNGTERPGAVYLASVLATHAQKGLPAFGIYGHEVQEADDTSIPADGLHPNAKGHKLISGRLYEYLTKKLNLPANDQVGLKK